MSVQTIERYVLRGMARDVTLKVVEHTDASTGWKPTRRYHVDLGSRGRVFKTMQGAVMWGRAALKDAGAPLVLVG